MAFAIGRAVGPAVVRNRMRRRLRAHLVDLVRPQAGPATLRSGWLLIGARPSACERSFEELGTELIALLTSIRPTQQPAEVPA